MARVLRRWTEDDGFPCEEIVAGAVECPRCGAEVEMTAVSDQWEEDGRGGWQIAGYGPAAAEHCGLLLAETDVEGTVCAFELGAAGKR